MKIVKSDKLLKKSKIKDSYLDIFKRFLKFGFLAWGGPVAQIDMLRQELVEEEKWVDEHKFNRVLGIYQALPGPEAQELCVYFGTVAKGRLGGLLAGLGFMLPGFLLMLALSWFYITVGINSIFFSPIFFGIQAAVIALIFRAVHRIGKHSITDKWLVLVLTLSIIGEAFNLNFLLILMLTGLVYLVLKRKKHFVGTILVSAFVVLLVINTYLNVNENIPQDVVGHSTKPDVSIGTLFSSGLKSGLLTFGGAYTVIPFLRKDAVGKTGWMSDSEFLDGLGLSGILPAPLVIFGTFVGFIGGGLLGGLAVTAGIFLPAFSFTLLFYSLIEKLSQSKVAYEFLYGVTAGVVGIIAVTAVDLFRNEITNALAFAIFALSLFVLYKWKSKLTVPIVVIISGLIGFVVKSLI